MKINFKNIFHLLAIRKKVLVLLPLISLFTALLYFSLQRHGQKGRDNWEKPIFSDATGYYSYLPATFIYHFDVDKFPDNIENKTGLGFNFENNKIKTKYTYGTALLQAPFFLGTFFYNKLSGYDSDGFSGNYEIMIDVSAAFYLVIGMFFLYLFLRFYYQPEKIIIALFFILSGTNLLFYCIENTGVSHVYSFACVSSLLFFFKKFLSNQQSERKYLIFLFFSIAASLVVIIRPLNVFIILFVLFWDIKNLEDFKTRFRIFISPKYLFSAIITFIIFITPQLIYWHYISGSYFIYSYSDESFNHLTNPQLMNIWFSPTNGAFLYSPLIVFCLAGSILMIKNKTYIGVYTLLLFFLISYIYASWHCWHLGCGYGFRPLVDIFPVLVFPLIYLLTLLKKKIVYIATIVIIFLFTIYNLNIITGYRTMFPGSFLNDWYMYKELTYGGRIYKNIFGKSKIFQTAPDKYITFKTKSGLFLNIDPNSHGNLVAKSDRLSDCEKFGIFYIDSITFCIRASNNMYVCSDGTDNNKLIANRAIRSSWEIFNLVKLPENKIAIRDYRGEFVHLMPESNIIVASQKFIEDSEKFEMIELQ